MNGDKCRFIEVEWVEKNIFDKHLNNSNEISINFDFLKWQYTGDILVWVENNRKADKNGRYANNIGLMPNNPCYILNR